MVWVASQCKIKTLKLKTINDLNLTITQEKTKYTKYETTITMWTFKSKSLYD